MSREAPANAEGEATVAKNQNVIPSLAFEKFCANNLSEGRFVPTACEVSFFNATDKSIYCFDTEKDKGAFIGALRTKRLKASQFFAASRMSKATK